MLTIIHIIFGLIKHPLVVIALFIALAFFVFSDRVEAPEINLPSILGDSNEQKENKPGFDKTRHSVDNPGSLWVVVNKQRPLPADYTPANLAGELRVDAKSGVDELLADAAAAGHQLYTISGYRSYQDQQATYSRHVQTYGQAEADRQSARPGHSEHQTGLAVDLGSGVCDLQPCFGDTEEGKWLADNAHKYGFIIRYQKNKTHITGFMYEPWHLRFVGKSLAKELHKTGQTMEEFFGLPPAPSY